MPRRASTPNTRAADTKREIARVRRKYKTDLTKRTKLLPAEIPHVENMVVVLKLAGYTRSQMAKVIGISRGQVKEILEKPETSEQIVYLRSRLPAAALELIQGLMIEAVMAIADVMRRTSDDKIILSAAFDLLDRGGAPKASRQERNTTTEEKLTVTDDGLVEKLRAAPPEVQEEAAQIIERLENLLAEHAGAVAEDEDESSE